MSELSILPSWPPLQTPTNLEDATFCSLKIEVDSKNVTAFDAESESAADCIQLPSYYLAEWIAENWWAILWEPRKNEDGSEDDPDFLARHSTLAAQHGFYLPHLQFVSNGPYIKVNAFARHVQFTEIRFINGASAFLDRSAVESALAEFVTAVTVRLAGIGLDETYLQECWEATIATEPDAVSYCRMMGALGLSPYSSEPRVDKILETISARLGDVYTLDLCLASRPEELKVTSRAAQVAVAALSKSPDLNLTSIAQVPSPRDDRRTQAWRRGRNAANILRKHFSLSEADASGADRIFEKVGIDPSLKASIGDKDLQPERAAIVGAVKRDGTVAQISCIQKHEKQRRFTAARGLFSAWTAGGHLLTQAVTRHQQSSRAFAAELLAPIEYIKKWRRGNAITPDDIYEICQSLMVGEDVVYKQAVNNGLAVRRA